MADNIVEYVLSLKDSMSPKLDEATNHVKKMEGAFGGLKETVAHTVEALGISFAVFKGFETIQEGIEKVEELHKAEAALANTMQNMGTYNQESFEKIIKGASELSQTVSYSKAQFIGLQSQLQLVGNIGEAEMNRLEKVSADYATKFGMDLETAGNTLAKAINNPEMARRLGMQLKIDPAVMEHIQNLAKHGKEAEARMELLSIAESKVGGAAEASFNADPLARFNKMMGSVKMAAGEAAIDMLKFIQPALETIGETIKNVAGEIRIFSAWVKENKQLLETIGVALLAGAVAFGVMTAAMNANAIAAAVDMAINEGLAMAITACGVAQEFLNATFIASPIGWIVLAVAGLAAGVMALVHHFGSFNAAMSATWEMIKAFGSGVIGVFKGVGETILGALTFNPKLISKGVADSLDSIKEAKKQIEAVWNNKDAQDAAAKNKGLVPGKETEGKKGKDGAAAIIADPKTKATGQKSVNIHIAINGGLIHGDFKIVTNKLGEGLGKVKDMVAEALTGAINDSQITASN